MTKRGFIEIDAGIAIAILLATMLIIAVSLLNSTAALKEKVATFKQMEKNLADKGQNCIATITLDEENKLRRVCNDSLT